MNTPTHVAVVDDDPAILDALRLYFQGEGVGTSCFETAATFLAATDQGRRFDCVVSDVRMPGRPTAATSSTATTIIRQRPGCETPMAFCRGPA